MKKRLRRLIDDRWRDVVPTLFNEAHERGKGNVYIPVAEVRERGCCESYLHRRAEELPDNKMYNSTEFQDFTKGLVRHFIESSTFVVPVNRSLKQKAEKFVAN